ncbi:MAG: AraC family transcriptional regulator [Gemmatimonadota bacterium]|jgi:AraC-like DNA-binding protein|nr:AraC family transcriptional regulator [Gemmatimonadota bacterium]
MILDIKKLLSVSVLNEVATEFCGERPAGVFLRPEILLNDTHLCEMLSSSLNRPHGAMDEATRTCVVKAAVAHLVHSGDITIDPAPPAAAGIRLSERKMCDLQAYIGAHLAERIKVEDLARQVGMSRSQFLPLFKATTGMTPLRFVMKIRLQSAEALLADRSLSLSDIAALTGFANPAHFTSTFRRAAKVTPSAFRARLMSADAESRSLRQISVQEAPALVEAVPAGPAELSLQQTSLRIDERVRLVRSSQGMGWTDLFAAETDEAPHEALHGAVQSIWIVTADTPNVISRSDSSSYSRSKGILPQQVISITPSGDVVCDELGSPLKARHLYLRQKFVDDVADEVFRDTSERRVIRAAFGTEDPVLSHLMKAIQVTLEEPAFGNRLKVDYLTQALATHLLTRHSIVGRSFHPVPDGVFNANQISLIMDYIGDNLTSDMNIGELAGLIGVGRSQFVQRFKATVKMTPHNFVLRRRIKKAQKLLADRVLSYTSIAFQCGFSDQSHFIAVFRRFMGVTPRQYRQMLVA